MYPLSAVTCLSTFIGLSVLPYLYALVFLHGKYIEEVGIFVILFIVVCLVSRTMGAPQLLFVE